MLSQMHWQWPGTYYVLAFFLTIYAGLLALLLCAEPGGWCWEGEERARNQLILGRFGFSMVLQQNNLGVSGFENQDFLNVDTAGKNDEFTFDIVFFYDLLVFPYDPLGLYKWPYFSRWSVISLYQPFVGDGISGQLVLWLFHFYGALIILSVYACICVWECFKSCQNRFVYDTFW